MRRFFLALVLFTFILAANSKSQDISYIIPDIGTPDFFTYVEIIAPHDEIGNFGTDGLYLNNSSDNMRLEVVNPADTNKLTIGPFVVSWNGRMIAAHFFVHPDLEPNSDFWDDLRNEFRIPIRAVINGSNSTVDTFYIVQPTELGTLTPSDSTIIGQGSLGKRSRRGAMIVGDVTFANQVYRVSTTDCDPYTDGNQAYLPFVLLSTGKIEGTNATLNLDGGYTVIRDAAPGGGGGGGRFCDVISTSGSSGDIGGNGFTSGGRGGQNHVVGDGDNLENYGQSSGKTGSSLNNITPPLTPFGMDDDQDTIYTYESAGGGTGHPFGECGVGSGSWAPYNDHPGGYGGGSGYGAGSSDDPRKGGSGAFATIGTDSETNHSTGGNVHGNEYLIPLAGGSGGASGNPVRGLWADVCSGNGAGGGGAIRLYSDLEISDITLSARGGDGQNGDPAGGSGSGGGVDVLAKKFLDANADVAGGAFSVTNFGGAGRISWATEMRDNSFGPAEATIFQSMTTDTNRLVRRSFNLKGTRNPNKNIRVFLKPMNGEWEEISGIDYLGQTWNIDLALPTPDSLFFLSAILVTDDGDNADEFQSKPDFLHTQASANILKIDKQPRCEGDSVMNFYPMQCDGSFDLYTAYIKNTGEGNLILEMQNHSYLQSIQGFELVSPLDETTVLPNNSAEIIVRFTYQDGQPKNLIDTLLIPHNDMEAEKKPWQIELNVEADTIHIEYWDVLSLNIFERIVFGDNCINSKDTISFYIVNFSDFPVTMNHIFEHQTGNAFSLDYPDGIIVGADSSLRVVANFNPDIVGLNESMLIFGIEECDTYSDTLYLEGNGVTGEFEFFDTADTLDLGEICIGDTTSKVFGVKNLSIVDVNFEDPSSSSNDFVPELSGRRNVPPDDTTTFLVRFTPTSQGEQIAKIYVFFNECGGDFDSVYVKGEGVTTDLEILDSGVFDDTNVGERQTKEIVLRNNGEGDAYIQSLPNIGPAFRVVRTTPALPVLLKKNETIRIEIEFAPNVDGEITKVMIVESLSIDGACPSLTSILLKGVGIRTEIRVSTFLLDYGLLAWCESTQDSVIIANDGSTTFSITELAVIEGSDSDVFMIAQQPQPDPTPTLQPGDSVVYYIRFVPEQGNEGDKNAQLVIKTDADNLPEIRIDLIGESEDLHLDFDVSSLDFGDVAIGESANIDITLINDGRIDWRVELVSQHPDVTIMPAGLTINAKSSESLVATFSPSQEGSITAQINLNFFNPCHDTLTITFSGRGIGGDIIIPDTLDLGVIYNCGILNDSIDMTNSGEANIEVLDMTIQDDTDSHFDYPDDQAFPITVEAGSRFSRDVVFYGNDAPDGFYYAKAVIKVIINQDTSEKTVILKAEINDGLNIYPSPLDFGNVVIGNSKTLSFTIINDGQYDLTITSLGGYLGVYTITPDWQTVLRQTLSPGQSITFDVEFMPDQENMPFASQIEVLYNAEDCPDETYSITLLGSSVAGKEVTLRLPNLDEIAPDIDDYSIPIFASADEELSEDLTLTAELSLNGTMFKPEVISNGSILESSWDAYYKTIRFEVNIGSKNQISTQETIIAEIIGATLLGNEKETALIWNKTDYSWTPENYVTETIFEDGILKSEICEEGGDRLINYESILSMKVQPNPAYNNIRIDITALETGWHSLEIANIHGLTTVIDNWQVSSDSNKEFTYNIQTAGLSSGIYYLIVKSPTDRKVETVFIIK